MTILKRHKDSHKGDNGTVLVVGGSELYTGAPAFVALSALRTGVDLVYVASPRRAADRIADFKPDLITLPLDGKFLNQSHVIEIEKFYGKIDVLVIGPGLGFENETKNAVLKLIKDCEVPIVIDADALKAIADDLDLIKDKEIVLTPHRKEFELISKGEKATTENVQKFTAKISPNRTVITLVKAPEDVITDGKIIKINKTGNPGMTVGGTGDTLAGIVAGLIAQKLTLFDSAYYASYINGKAGDICFEEKGYGFITSDLIEKIPIVLKEV